MCEVGRVNVSGGGVAEECQGYGGRCATLDSCITRESRTLGRPSRAPSLERVWELRGKNGRHGPYIPSFQICDAGGETGLENRVSDLRHKLE